MRRKPRFGKKQDGITYFKTHGGLKKISCPRCHGMAQEMGDSSGRYRCGACGATFTRQKM